MGKCYAFTYRVEYRDQSGWHQQGWSKRRASQRGLETWRRAMNRSFQSTGANYHLSKQAGYLLHISHARLVHQRSGLVVAKVEMPTFEAV